MIWYDYIHWWVVLNMFTFQPNHLWFTEAKKRYAESSWPAILGLFEEPGLDFCSQDRHVLLGSQRRPLGFLLPPFILGCLHFRHSSLQSWLSIVQPVHNNGACWVGNGPGVDSEDLKPENVTMDSFGMPKATDLVPRIDVAHVSPAKVSHMTGYLAHVPIQEDWMSTKRHFSSAAQGLQLFS